MVIPLKRSARPSPSSPKGPHPVSEERVTKAQESCRLMDFS